MDKVKLKDIAEIISGQSPSSSSYNKEGKGLPFFQGKADFDVKYPQIKNWCTYPLKIAYPNDILISVRAPVGPVNICTTESCIGRGLSAIRVNKRSYYEFVYYYLKENESQITKLGVGSTFPAITQKDLAAIKIPLFLIETQIRVAKLLSEAEELIEERKKSIDLLNKLLKNKYLEIFGDPVSNNKNWEKSPISKYSSSIVPGRDKPKSFTGQIPWVTTSDLDNLGFVEKSIDNIGLTVSEITEVKAKIIPQNSVIVTCVGDLGKVSINKKEIVINQQLHAYQCNENINSIFTMYSLSFQKDYMYRMATTTTVPYMNKTACNSIPIIIPPLSLQNQFATIVEEVESIKKDYKQSLSELENLYGSLSQRAFKGELDLSRLDITEELKAHESITLQNRKEDKILWQESLKIEKKITNNEAAVENLAASVIQAALDLPSELEVFNTEQIANLLKERYAGFHFSFEMAYRYLSKRIRNIDSHYFYSEELLADPSLKNEANFKDFFESALQKKNQFIQLEQQFYNPEKENFDLRLTVEDYNLWKDKKDRSGIYFSII